LRVLPAFTALAFGFTAFVFLAAFFISSSWASA
jgi:hypothetical protein